MVTSCVQRRETNEAVGGPDDVQCTRHGKLAVTEAPVCQAHTCRSRGVVVSDWGGAMTPWRGTTAWAELWRRISWWHCTSQYSHVVVMPSLSASEPHTHTKVLCMSSGWDLLSSGTVYR